MFQRESSLKTGISNPQGHLHHLHSFIEVQGTSKLPLFSRGTLRITAMAGESGLRESETSSCAWSGQPNGQDWFVMFVMSQKLKASKIKTLDHWSLVKIDQFDKIFAGHLNFDTSAKWCWAMEVKSSVTFHGRTTPRKFDKWIPGYQKWWDLEKETAFFWTLILCWYIHYLL